MREEKPFFKNLVLSDRDGYVNMYSKVVFFPNKASVVLNEY